MAGTTVEVEPRHIAEGVGRQLSSADGEEKCSAGVPLDLMQAH